MPSSAPIVTPDFRTWALTVTDVGTWRCSLDEEWVRCDAIMADQFGLSETEAQHGISFARLRGIIHPEDRYLFDRKNERVREAGGFIVTEYRVVPRPDEVRWVLVRGRYDPGQPNSIGGMTGHGISIDITATKADGLDRADGFCAASGFDGAARDGLHEVADAAIALRHAVDRLGETVPGVREAADVALHLIARRLAERMIPDGLN